MYLADWKHAIHHGKQISNLNWYFDNYGPFAIEVLEVAKSSDEFQVTQERKYLGLVNSHIRLAKKIKSNINKEERRNRHGH